MNLLSQVSASLSGMGRRGRDAVNGTTSTTRARATFMSNFSRNRGRGRGRGRGSGRRGRGRACEGTGQYECFKCGNRYKQKQSLKKHCNVYTIAQPQDDGSTKFIKERWCAQIDAEKIDEWKKLNVRAQVAPVVSRERQDAVPSPPPVQQPRYATHTAVLQNVQFSASTFQRTAPRARAAL